MKRICLFVLVASALGFPNLNAAKIDLGMSVIYFPTARLDYYYSSNASYQLVDNIFWQSEITYVLGHGFRVGAIVSLYKKGLDLDSHNRVDISMWEAGLAGNYAYSFTEAGHTFLILGAELAYANINDRANTYKDSKASVLLAGYVGMRYVMFHNTSIEVDYRLNSLEFNIKKTPQRKYKFTGNSLKLTLGYEFNI